MAAKNAPVALTHAYWDDKGTRHEVGTVIELPTKDAKALIEAGKAVRADPMPGDE
jgi:hypothetical protein